MQNTFARPRFVFGLILILVGIGKLLDNLDLLPSFEMRQFWPVFLVVVGVARLLAGDWTRGFFLTVLGGVLLLPALVPAVTWESLFEQWPVFVIVAGIFIVLRSFFGQDRSVPTKTSDRIDAFGFFNAHRVAVKSESFAGGELAAMLGSCEIDLTDSELAPTGAVIDIFAMWGGLTVRVPKHWILDLQVLPVMGGAEDKTRQAPARSGPRLIIRGFVLMGGIEVMS